MAEQDDEGGVRILASEAFAQRISGRAFMGGSVAVAFAGGAALLAACSNSTSSSGSTSGAASGAVEDKLNFLHWAAYDDPNLSRSSRKSSDRRLDHHVHLERGRAHEAPHRAGHRGLRHRRTDRPVHPAVRQEQPAPGIGSVKDPELQTSIRSSRTSRGTPQRGTRSSRTGVRPGGSSTRARSRHRSNLERLHRRRDARGERQRLPAGRPERGHGCVLLGERDRLDDHGPGAPRRVRGVDQTDGAPREVVRVLPRLPIRVRELDLVARVERRRTPGFQLVQGPEPVRVGTGAPQTELWMDNWTIAQGAPHPNAAYAFINFILDPKNSLQDLEFHGYNTGIPVSRMPRRRPARSSWTWSSSPTPAARPARR